MGAGVKSKRLRVNGMTCVNCQNKIEKKLLKTAGVKRVKVSYSTGVVDVTYDTDIIALKDISAVIEKLGYKVFAGGKRGGPHANPSVSHVIGTLIIILSLYMILQQFGVLNLLVPSQLADTRMGYGMLFVIGLITSVHCIAMCGGINLSQCIPRNNVSDDGTVSGSVNRNASVYRRESRLSLFAPAFLYNSGRIISYTVLGFILGLAGFLFVGGSEVGLPVIFQGILKLIAGVFMIIMGINMLGIFPWLRRLNPRMPEALARKIDSEKARRGRPLVVGLLNGLMPCGPLQSMQIISLASANPLVGAFSMFLFSLGTAPLMLGLGSIVSALGKKFTERVMNAGAILVVVLGLAMLSQGGSLSGLLPPDLLLRAILAFCVLGAVASIPFRTPSYKTLSTLAALGIAFLIVTSWSWSVIPGSSSGDNSVQIIDGKQVVSSALSSGRYPDIRVQAGTPVKWIIDAPEGSINGCNNRIFIHEYGIEYSFKPGENVIEFTPDKEGPVRYSCWMGMIRGTINVTEAEGEMPSPAY